MSDGYVPNELLSRLVGRRMYSVEFVLNAYVQLRFDSDDTEPPPTLNCEVWPVIRVGGRDWRESDLGYADAVRRLTPGLVVSTTEATGVGLRIDLDTGSIVIHPSKEEVYAEIALLSFADGTWMCWRPGEVSFEDLA